MVDAKRGLRVVRPQSNDQQSQESAVSCVRPQLNSITSYMLVHEFQSKGMAQRRSLQTAPRERRIAM